MFIATNGTTPCQNHLYIEDESQNFDEMRAVGSSSPARGRFRNFSTFVLASSSTDDFCTGYADLIDNESPGESVVVPPAAEPLGREDLLLPLDDLAHRVQLQVLCQLKGIQ